MFLENAQQILFNNNKEKSNNFSIRKNKIKDLMIYILYILCCLFYLHFIPVRKHNILFKILKFDYLYYLIFAENV